MSATEIREQVIAVRTEYDVHDNKREVWKFATLGDLGMNIEDVGKDGASKFVQDRDELVAELRALYDEPGSNLTYVLDGGSNVTVSRYPAVLNFTKGYEVWVEEYLKTNPYILVGKDEYMGADDDNDVIWMVVKNTVGCYKLWRRRQRKKHVYTPRTAEQKEATRLKCKAKEEQTHAENIMNDFTRSLQCRVSSYIGRALKEAFKHFVKPSNTRIYTYGIDAKDFLHLAKRFCVTSKSKKEFSCDKSDAYDLGRMVELVADIKRMIALEGKAVFVYPIANDYLLTFRVLKYLDIPETTLTAKEVKQFKALFPAKEKKVTDG